MTGHGKTARLLVDYALGSLGPGESESVERHVARCGRCAAELEELRAVLPLVSGEVNAPSSGRPPEYWNSFSSRVETRLGEKREPAGSFLWDLLEPVMRRPLVAGAALGGALAVLLLTMPSRKEPAPPTEEAVAEAAPTEAQLRAGQYFRKSKALLMGLENTTLPADQEIDLSTERRISRELLHEGRYLRTMALDRRSNMLISDLDKIFIELANARHEEVDPQVRLLRGGITKQNLLFKIRMSESYFQTVRDESRAGVQQEYR